MSQQDFFDESTELSAVKRTIVSKYFPAWARIIMPTAKTHGGEIAYVDLFAGPGVYKDGTESTPLLVLKRAIQDPDMRKMLSTFFNDVNRDNAQSLEIAITNLPDIELLAHKPHVDNMEVGEEVAKLLEERHPVPTLFFLDPWGYKGLSQRLVNAVLRDWGSDCILFFNYNRVNMALSNDLFEEPMDALFGKDRADRLRAILDELPPEGRELVVIDEIAEALRDVRGKYVLPFCFKNEGNRTSHYLIFVSKSFKGYELMKEIMARESSTHEQGVPSFAYCAADRGAPMLFELSRPLDELGDILLREFGGQRLTMQEVYEKHNVGTPYIKRNYKHVLGQLEADGKIETSPPAERRLRRAGAVTFADDVLVTFTPK